MIKVFLLIAVMILFTSLLSAQTAEQIFDKSLSEMGYTAHDNGPGTMKITGKMSFMGMEMPFTMYNKTPAFRIEQEMMGQKTTVAFDGKEGWAISPMQGNKPTKISEKDLGSMKTQSNFSENPILTLKKEGAKFEKLANEAYEGKDAFKIKITTKDNEERIILIDAKSYFPLKINQKQVGMSGQPEDAEIVFRDYKAIGKYKMSHLMEMTMMGNVIKVIFDKVEIGIPIDTKLFAMPEN